MAASGANILRFSALFGGVFYGFYHQSSLNRISEKHAAERKYQNEVSLIEKAKAEYIKKTTPQDKQGAGNGVISNPDDPKFDLEAYLKNVEATSK